MTDTIYELVTRIRDTMSQINTDDEYAQMLKDMDELRMRLRKKPLAFLDDDVLVNALSSGDDDTDYIRTLLSQVAHKGVVSNITASMDAERDIKHVTIDFQVPFDND